MKISNEQLSALQNTEARRKTQAQDQGFEALLGMQLEDDQAQGVAPAANAVSTLGGLLPGVPSSVAGMGEGANVSASAPNMFGDASDEVDDVLNGLDAYANQLASSDPTSLKAASAQLDKMSGRIAALRAAHPDMDKHNPEMASMVNDMDVLATTERFKLNRGDYL